MDEELKKQVEILVTEKLNNFTFLLADHIEQSVQGAVKHEMGGKFQNIDRYIKDDEEWKKDLSINIKPALTAFNNGSIVLRVVIGTVKILGILGGALAALYGGLLAVKDYIK